MNKTQLKQQKLFSSYIMFFHHETIWCKNSQSAQFLDLCRAYLLMGKKTDRAHFPSQKKKKKRRVNFMVRENRQMHFTAKNTRQGTAFS